MHRASGKKKERMKRKEGAEGQGGVGSGEEERGREARRRRRRIANGRMGAFETRSKGTTGSRGTLCREIIVPLNSARHGTAPPGSARRGSARRCRRRCRRRRNLWPCRRIFSRPAKLTTVRVTLFSFGNKGCAARRLATELSRQTVIPTSDIPTLIRRVKLGRFDFCARLEQ